MVWEYVDEGDCDGQYVIVYVEDFGCFFCFDEVEIVGIWIFQVFDYCVVQFDGEFYVVLLFFYCVESCILVVWRRLKIFCMQIVGVFDLILLIVCCDILRFLVSVV